MSFGGNETLSCRGCGHALVDDRTCALCHDFKTRNLVIEGILAGDDEPDLVSTSEELVSLIRWNVRMLRTQARKTKDYDPDIGKQIQQLARSAQGLLDSARKLQEQGADSLRAMGIQERLVLVKEWLDELPPEIRRKALDTLGRARLQLS